MPQRWRSPQQLYTAAIVGIVSLACYTTRPVPPAALASHAPARVLLTQLDSTVVVWYPRVSGDTLQGVVDGARERFVISPHTSIATRDFAAPKTVGVALVGAGVLAFLIYEAAGSHSDDPCRVLCPVKPGCPVIPCPEQ